VSAVDSDLPFQLNIFVAQVFGGLIKKNILFIYFKIVPFFNVATGHLVPDARRFFIFKLGHSEASRTHPDAKNLILSNLLSHRKVLSPQPLQK
jgi:hypothetical protein